MFGWFKSKPKSKRYYMIRFYPQWWEGPEKKGRKAFNKIFGEEGDNFINKVDGVELSGVFYNVIFPQINFDMWMEHLKNSEEEGSNFFVEGETYKALKASKYFSINFEEEHTDEISEKVESTQFTQKFKMNKEAIVKKLGLNECEGCERLLATYLREDGRCSSCRERAVDNSIVKEVTNAL